MSHFEDHTPWRFGFEDQPDDRPDLDGPDVPIEVAILDCWRCGKSVEETLPICPHCRARLIAEEKPEPQRGRQRRPAAGSLPTSPVVSMIYVYLGLLMVSVVFNAMMTVSLAQNGPIGGDPDHQRLTVTFIMEAIDTVLVVVGFALTKRPPALGPISTGRRMLAWLAAIPLLALMMAMNFAYMHFVKTGLGLPDASLEMAKRPELFYGVLIAICIQPAIVEEVFFRYLALGQLRTIVGTPGAVIVSGVMFGLAHLGNPLGIPYLIVMGIGLGAIRVAGRSMMIPILIHFAHNAMVLWLPQWL